MDTHVRINWPAPLVTRPPFMCAALEVLNTFVAIKGIEKSRGEKQINSGRDWKKKKRRLAPETWLLWTRFKWGACSFVVRKDKVHNWQQTTNTHTGTLFKLGLFSGSTFFGCGTSNARSNLFISSYFNSPFHFTFLFSWRNFFFLSTWKSFTPHEDN